MTEQPKKPVQKALPFKNKHGFTGLPNEIFKLYVSHPQWTANCLLVYMYLLHRYNEEWHYAFPSQDTIADNTFIDRRSISGIIKRLEVMELITVMYNGDYGNHVYLLKKPISNRDEFEERFPEARAKREKFESKRTVDREGRQKRRADFREQVQHSYAEANQ